MTISQLRGGLVYVLRNIRAQSGLQLRGEQNDRPDEARQAPRTGLPYTELARIKVAGSQTYAYPIVSGKRLFVKDQDSVTLWAIPAGP
jgi:hypothetical protein